MLARLCIGLACALLAGVGCRSVEDAALLSIEQVTPSLAEPGTTLEVIGDGFAPGRRCRVTLDGRTFRPGARPERVHAVLPGHAGSDDRVEVTLDRAAFAELGSHGTFEGELRVSFDAAAGGSVSGSTRLRLDLQAPMARGPAHRDALNKQALRMLSFLGIRVAQDAPVTEGLPIEWAAKDSIAAAGGLESGDLIVRAAGVGVHSLGDMVPPPGSRRLEIEVEHSRGERRTHLLSLGGFMGPDLDSALARLSGLGVLLLLCLAFLTPLPTPAHFIARCASRHAHAERARLGVFGGERPTTRPARVRRVLLSICASVWGTLLVYADPAGVLRVRSLSLYLAFAALSLTLTFFGPGSLATRWRSTASTALSLFSVAVVIACACALSGTRSFSGMVAGQGAWPWQWAVFEQPSLFVAFPLYLVYASRLGQNTLPIEVPGRFAQVLNYERVMTHVLLSALGVAIFFGGFQWPVWLAPEGVPPRFLGAIVFVAKTWMLAAALRLSASARLGAAMRWPGVVATGVCVGGLTALWLWWQPSPAVALAIGTTLGAASALSLAIGALAWRLDKQPMGAAVAWKDAHAD